jgi:dermatan 4-sulfotransferase 1
MKNTQHFILFTNLPLMYGRVPKVANSSIKAALCRFLSTPPDEGVRTTADSFWRDATHGETSLISPRQARQLRKSHFSFSFVRNPFDRLVSAYNNKLVENDSLSEAMKGMGLRLRMPFSDFVENVCAAEDDIMDVHLLPQSTILCAAGRLVPKFIGRMENMEAHWSILQRRMRKLGLPKLGMLPQKNVRRVSGSPLTEYFVSTSLIDKVAQRYQRDLELFYDQSSLASLAAGGPLEAFPPLQRGRGKKAVSGLGLN